MKMLKKLALVSAISMISAGAFAMEAMDDESMAAATGQDGITINIVPDVISGAAASAMGVSDATKSAIADLDNNPLTVDPAPLYKGLSIGEIRVHDDDGLGVLGTDATANSGALVIGGGYDKNNDGDFVDAGETTVNGDRTVVLAKGDKPIQINIDMIGDSNGATAGGGAMLNVEIKQPALAIKLGNIYVANSNAAPDDFDADGGAQNDADSLDNQDGTTVSGKVKILDGLEIVMAESTMTIQLGNESQGSMIVANAVLTNGLTLNNFALYDESGAAALTADNLIAGDVGSGGSIRATSIKITDNGGTNLTAMTAIDVGSRITLASTVTPGSAGETAYKDKITLSASNGNFTTYAAAVAAGAAGAAVVAGVDAATAYATTLVNATANTAGNWGGVDTYNGLVITSQLGNATTGADITINNLALGDLNASVMGDVQIIGLMLGKSKIVIMGH